MRLCLFPRQPNYFALSYSHTTHSATEDGETQKPAPSRAPPRRAQHLCAARTPRLAASTPGRRQGSTLGRRQGNGPARARRRPRQTVAEARGPGAALPGLRARRPPKVAHGGGEDEVARGSRRSDGGRELRCRQGGRQRMGRGIEPLPLAVAIVGISPPH